MNRERKGHWNRWGPYGSERAWGPVREDYSPDGNAWNHFPHDHARFRAYRWNEDGLAGICDRHQYLCFALALWNGRDPLLKERLFGLNGWEGNHGEDVKEYYFYLDSTPTHSYTENETNCERLYGTRSAAPFVKDAFSSYVVDGRIDAVNSAGCGTKPAARYYCEVAPGETAVLQLRLAASNGKPLSNPFSGFDSSFELRIHEADEFYNVVIPSTLSEDEKRVVRQAFAGMLWSKQFYHYVVSDWLRGDPAQPAPPHQRRGRRNKQWSHVYNRDVVSMPDKWEFPWFASWDLGFHCVV